MEENSIFCQRLKEARTKKGWSQAELARHANITPAAVNQFEKGPRKPSLPILHSLASALEVSLDYLAGESDKPNEAKIQTEWVEFFRNFQDLSDKDREILKAQVDFLKQRAKSSE